MIKQLIIIIKHSIVESELPAGKIKLYLPVAQWFSQRKSDVGYFVRVTASLCLATDMWFEETKYNV